MICEQKQTYLLPSDSFISCCNIILVLFRKSNWRGTNWTWLPCEILLYLRQDYGVLPYSMSQEDLALLISASFILCFVNSHCPSEFVQTSIFQMSDYFFFFFIGQSASISFKQKYYFPCFLISYFFTKIWMWYLWKCHKNVERTCTSVAKINSVTASLIYLYCLPGSIFIFQALSSFTTTVC